MLEQLGYVLVPDDELVKAFVMAISTSLGSTESLPCDQWR